MRILKARFRTKDAFLEAFQKTPVPGGLFCATTQPLKEDEPVVVEIFFPELPNRVLARGKVLWWRRALPRQRVRAGCFVVFDPDEKDKLRFVLGVVDGAQQTSVRRRHARLPVRVPVRWRAAGATEGVSTHIVEVGVGGALLVTDTRPPIGSEIVLEILLPGAARASTLAAKVAYVAPTGVGVRFLYRDGGGSRRVREFIRRIKGQTH